MEEYTNKPICEKIHCPYWSGDSSRYGCQAYAVANHCHLLSLGDKISSTNQYALYPAEIRDKAGDVIGQHRLTLEELEQVKQANDRYWGSSDRHDRDLALRDRKKGRGAGWVVSDIKEKAEIIR